MLPHRSGFEVLKVLRQHSNIPVILLTARDSETDRVVGLELGADDYVPKPFKPRELVARIRAVLRRTQRPAHDAAVEQLELQVGDVRLSPAARFAARGDRKLDLTSAEFDLLQQFLQSAGTPASRDALAQAALGRVNGLGTSATWTRWLVSYGASSARTTSLRRSAMSAISTWRHCARQADANVA